MYFLENLLVITCLPHSFGKSKIRIRFLIVSFYRWKDLYTVPYSLTQEQLILFILPLYPFCRVTNKYNDKTFRSMQIRLQTTGSGAEVLLLFPTFNLIKYFKTFKWTLKNVFVWQQCKQTVIPVANIIVSESGRESSIAYPGQAWADTTTVCRDTGACAECWCAASRGCGGSLRGSARRVVPATRKWRKAQLSLRAPRAVVVIRPPPRLVRSDVLRLRHTPQCSVTQLSVCALYRTSRIFSRKLISMWMRRFYLFNTKTSEMLFAH